MLDNVLKYMNLKDKIILDLFVNYKEWLIYVKNIGFFISEED